MGELVAFLVICWTVYGSFSQDTDPRFAHYLTLINDAVTKYEDCNQSKCSCHLSVMDRDLSSWEKGISKEVFQATKSHGTHYQIIDHKLYREKHCVFPLRCSGVEHFLLQITYKLPDMELVINTRDYPRSPRNLRPLPVFSFSKDGSVFDIMYPAWTFWEGGPDVRSIYPTGLGRWDLQREIISKEAKKWPWHKKENVAFFRGSRTSAERDALVVLSREHPELVQAQYTKNRPWKTIKDTLGMPPAKEIKLEEHCKYKYLFNMRGVAASFRFKHLFLCESVVFHVGHEWQEFFYPAMKPWVHYIPVRWDLTDARELLQFAQVNDEVVRGIAKRGRQFIWDHLRMEDVSCYWEKLLMRYAKLINFKPKRNPQFHQVLKEKDEL